MPTLYCATRGDRTMNELIEYQLPAPPETGTYVRLETVGNPDFNQYAPISEPRWAPCFSDNEDHALEEAQGHAREYIEYWNAGGGNWVGGDVYRDGERIAYISYNGRVWRPGDEHYPEARPFAKLSWTQRTMYGLDNREHAAVLAGLRAWQTMLEGLDPRDRFEALDDNASNLGTVAPLNISEIDELCERINQ